MRKYLNGFNISDLNIESCRTDSRKYLATLESNNIAFYFRSDNLFRSPLWRDDLMAAYSEYAAKEVASIQNAELRKRVIDLECQTPPPIQNTVRDKAAQIFRVAYGAEIEPEKVQYLIDTINHLQGIENGR